MTTGTVDCDVHCTVPSSKSLFPYLEEQWSDFISWTSFRDPGGINLNYPRWSPMFSAEQVGVEQLQEDVLGTADRAILQCYFGIETVTHPYLAAALAQAVNRWMADEWLDRDERLLGTVSITPQHVPQAVEEIERAAADKRFVQVLLPSRSDEPYGNQRYWPIFETAAEHGLVLALAYGGIPRVRWTPSFFEDYALVTGVFQTQLTSLVMCGIFDRWPTLKVTVCESGWTWLPALFWRIDQEWKAYDSEVPWLKEAPSAYVRRHFRFTTCPVDAPEEPVSLAHTLDQIGLESMPGSDLLLYSSDYPHAYDGDSEPLLELLDQPQRERVMCANAREWYGL